MGKKRLQVAQSVAACRRHPALGQICSTRVKHVLYAREKVFLTVREGISAEAVCVGNILGQGRALLEAVPEVASCNGLPNTAGKIIFLPCSPDLTI